MAEKELAELERNFAEYIQIDHTGFQEFRFFFEREVDENADTKIEGYSCSLDVVCPAGYPWEAHAEFDIIDTNLTDGDRELLGLHLFQIAHNNMKNTLIKCVEHLVGFIPQFVPACDNSPMVSLPSRSNLNTFMSPQIHLSPQPLPLKGPDEGEIRNLLMAPDFADAEVVNIPCPRLVTVSWGPNGELVYASNLNFEEPQNIRLYEQSRTYAQLLQVINTDTYTEYEVSMGLGEKQIIIQWDSQKLWTPDLVDQIRLDPSVEACTHNMNLFSDQPVQSEIWRLLRAVIESTSSAHSFFQPDIAVVQNLIRRANSIHDSSTLACVLRMIYGTHLQRAIRRGYQAEGLTKFHWKEILEGHVRVFTDYLYRIGRYIMRNKILQCIAESDYCKSMVENLRMPWLNYPVLPSQTDDISVHVRNAANRSLEVIWTSEVNLSYISVLVTVNGEDITPEDVSSGGSRFLSNPYFGLPFGKIEPSNSEEPEDAIIVLGSHYSTGTNKSGSITMKLNHSFWNDLFEVSILIGKEKSNYHFIQIPLLISGTLNIEHCSVCCLPVKKSYTIVCPNCFHGGHIVHITQWLVENDRCPALGCDCLCASYLDLSEAQLGEEAESDSNQEYGV